MQTAYELAQKYYPRLWNEDRIRALQNAGKLSQKEVMKILSKETESK